MATPYTSGAVELSTLSGDDLTDSLIQGRNWVSSTITFSFANQFSTWSDSTTNAYGPPNQAAEPWETGYGSLAATQKDAVRVALSGWAKVSGLKFKEVADNRSVVGDIRFAFASGELQPDAQAWAYYPASNKAYAGDVWFSNTSTSFTEKSWGRGSYEYMAAIHEIGHALGLKHSFSASPLNTQTLDASLDSRSFTVMSYSGLHGRAGGTFSYEPTTPMVLDIAAIQQLYGADTVTNAGDTVYTYTQKKDYHHTIWDAGGNDTILYNSLAGGVIDLREGYDFGSRLGNSLKVYDEDGVRVRSGVDNVWIAFGAVIENARGGAGNDTIFGNNAANLLNGSDGNDNLVAVKGRDTLTGGGGNDRLSGGVGNDTLTGGSGADRFVFNTTLNTTYNIDKVIDFQRGIDVIQLDNAIFGGLGNGDLNAANFKANASGQATDANDFIVYETDTGKLFYDADGNGAGARVQFALIGISAHAALTAGDFVVI